MNFFLNHPQEKLERIGLVSRSLNTRKKADGLFSIPTPPSHGSEILWKIPHLCSQPSLTKHHSRPKLSLICDTSVFPRQHLNLTHCKLGLTDGATLSGISEGDLQNSVTQLNSLTKHSSRHSRKPRYQVQDQVTSSLL